ncbi:MAG: helix-turn-helix transcriptional regulator [Lewinellaceae bacterium]|nr:helix-turn-helix transcriptional regulator [Lewinellaceae bacterium]
MHLSKNIKHLRQEHRLTQEDLASQIDKSKGNISAYEKGKILPPVDVIIKFCEIFNVSLDDIIHKDLSKEGPGRPDDEAPRTEYKPTAEDEELLRRFLVLKLEEVANALKEEKPELYNRLQLDKLIKKEKNFE